MISPFIFAIALLPLPQVFGQTSYNQTTKQPTSCSSPWAGHSSQPFPTQYINTTGWSSKAAQSYKPTASVTVGAGGRLVFAPPTIQASIGTIIWFEFLAMNHTLTQSDLWHPCESNGGFDTGFHQFNPKNTSGRFVVEYEVEHLDPQWFFCSQTFKKSHCNAGMVFSINPGGSQNQFIQNALAAVVSRTSASACQLPHFGLSKTTATITAGPTVPVATGTASDGHIPVSSTRISPPIPLANSGSSSHANAIILALVVLGFW